MSATSLVDEIIIAADPQAVFAAAAQVERWPRLLPHYRWVTVLADAPPGRLVEMAARRGPVPVKWTSVQTTDPERGEIHYTHVAGLTRGMQVLWQVLPETGRVRVRIIHELTLQAPLVRTALGRAITAEFIHTVAQRTLRHLKGHLEGRP